MNSLAFLVIVIATGIQGYSLMFDDARIGRQDISPSSEDPIDPSSTTINPSSTTSNPSSTTSNPSSTTSNPSSTTSNPSSTTQNPNSTTLPPIVQPGSSAILNAGDIRKISSSGFGGGILTYQFLANNCRLDATCPCVGIPASWNCLKNGYLEIRSGFLWDRQKFCGGNRPFNFTSDTGELTISYKPSDDPRTTGFTCYISCTTYGQPHAPLPVGC